MRIYILSSYCFKGAVWLVSGGGGYDVDLGRK